MNLSFFFVFCILIFTDNFFSSEKYRAKQLALLSDPLLSGIKALQEQNCQDLHEEGHYEQSVDQLSDAIKPLIPVSPHCSPSSSRSSYNEESDHSSNSSHSSICGCDASTKSTHIFGCKHRFKDFLTAEQVAGEKKRREENPTSSEEKEATTCIILGDTTVGKTVLVNYMFNGQFIDNPMTRCPERKDRIAPGFVDQLWHLWDAPGQHSCEKFNNGLLPNAHFFVIMYACDNRESFENVEHHLERVKKFKKQQQSSTGTIYLVSNKIDLPEQNHKVSRKEGLKFAVKHGLQFYEVSSKYGRNVPALWTSLGLRRFQWIRDIMRKLRSKVRSCTGTEVVNLSTTKTEPKSTCC